MVVPGCPASSGLPAETDPTISSLKFTPLKVWPSSVGQTGDGIYGELEAGLSLHLYENIDTETFLKLCSGGLDENTDKKMKNQLADILSWGVDTSESYKLTKGRFQYCNDNNREVSAYESFIKMGNMFLEYAEQKDTSARKVRLLSHHTTKLGNGYVDKKPDIVLVPKTVEERVAGQRAKNLKASRKAIDPETGRALVPEVLVPFEMKTNNFWEDDQDSTMGFQSDSLLGKRSHRGFETSAQPRVVKKMKTTAGGMAIARLDMQLKECGNPDVQLASYAIELMSYRGDRSYTFGAKVKGAYITLFFYHRSAIFASKEFSFIIHPEYFAFFLIMFTRNPNTYGFNKNMGYTDPFDLGNPTTQRVDVDWILDVENIVNKDVEEGARKKHIVEDANRDLDLNIVKKMVLKERIVCHYCLIGRGTSVIAAVTPPPETPETAKPLPANALVGEETGPCSSKNLKRSARHHARKATVDTFDHRKAETTTSSDSRDVQGKGVPALPEQKKYAFKLSWQVETQEAEIRFLIAARRHLPDNIPKVYGYAIVKDNTPARNFIEYCRTHLNNACERYEVREMRVIVMDYFEGLDKVEDDLLFQRLMFQCMGCK